MCRPVDDLQRSRSIQRMKAPSWPAGRGLYDRVYGLGVTLGVKTGDFRKSDAGPVAVSAILHRTPKSPVATHEYAGRARAALIHQDRISRVRLPRAEKGRRAEDRERIGKAACSVPRRRKHP